MDARSRTVLRRRVLDDDVVPLRRLGRELEMSREGVRQIQARGLRELRDSLVEFEDWSPEGERDAPIAAFA
jgi:DNA-directed RNA polymerase sigma subunit (sigma70/sigma32)